MNKKPVILLDVDGVVADLLSALLNRFNLLHGTDVGSDDIKEWDIANSISLVVGDAHATCMQIFSEPGFAMAITPYAGAVEAYAALKRDCDVHFVTSPAVCSQTWSHDRRNWLRCVFGADDKHIHMTHAKEMMRGDIIIDDKIENIMSWLEVNPDGIGIVVERSYNTAIIESMRLKSNDSLYFAGSISDVPDRVECAVLQMLFEKT